MLSKPQKTIFLHFVFIVALAWSLLGAIPVAASSGDALLLLTPTPSHTSTPVSSSGPLYLSLTSGQTIGGVASSDEDILKFDGASWSLFFDGSDVGLATPDLFAFSLLDGDTILMSFSANVTVQGISATPQDVLRFDATSLGSVTTGTFSLYFDGSDVGLEDATNEIIDSLKLLPDGRLLLSTNGNPVIPGLAGARDEDVIAFSPTSLGNVTSGAWSLYFDGSDVGLAETSAEDIDALDVVGGNVYLSTQGDFSVSGLSGADEDVFVCAATSLGDVTTCTYSPSLYFDGSTWGLSANDVDAFHFLAGGATPTVSPTITQTPTRTPIGATVTPDNTVSPTGTFCPVPTPENLSVEPVASPTHYHNAVVTVRMGNGDSLTVSSESGTYTRIGDFSTSNPAVISIPLLDDTIHHLTVSAHVKPVVGPGGCTYGNYTLTTTVDKFGAPLTIVQTTGTHTPPPTPGGNLAVFSPVADTYVSAENPASNYGSNTMLRTDATPDIRSYLRFQVQGLTKPVLKATLRLSAQTTSSVGYQVRGVSNNTWTESTLNYNNAPALGSLIGASGAMTANFWTSVDVTSYITGNGVFNLAVTSNSSTSFTFASRESSYLRPELIIETQSSTTPTAIFTTTPVAPTGTNTPTLTPSPTGTNPVGSSSTPTISVNTYTYTSIADAYVNASSPATNYGTQTTLRMDANPILRSYLRFNVQGLNGNVTRATLRIFANSASSTGFMVSGVSDNTWVESAINFNNAPAVGSALGASGAFGAGVWISINITAYVTGDGAYNLVLTTPGDTAISLASLESVNDPQLIVETTP